MTDRVSVKQCLETAKSVDMTSIVIIGRSSTGTLALITTEENEARVLQDIEEAVATYLSLDKEAD